MEQCLLVLPTVLLIGLPQTDRTRKRCRKHKQTLLRYKSCQAISSMRVALLHLCAKTAQNPVLAILKFYLDDCAHALPRPCHTFFVLECGSAKQLLVSQATPSTTQHRMYCITGTQRKGLVHMHAIRLVQISRFCRDQSEVCAVKSWCAYSGKCLLITWKYRVKQLSDWGMIPSFIRGNDVFVSLPTGYSKSLLCSIAFSF